MVEWIKCSDQPPEADKDLLIWDGNYVSIGTLLYVEDSTYVFIVGGTTFDATHWAERPEPPMSDNAQLFYDKSIEYGIGMLTTKWISKEEARQMWPEVPNDRME